MRPLCQSLGIDDVARFVREGTGKNLTFCPNDAPLYPVFVAIGEEHRFHCIRTVFSAGIRGRGLSIGAVASFRRLIREPLVVCQKSALSQGHGYLGVLSVGSKKHQLPYTGLSSSPECFRCSATPALQRRFLAGPHAYGKNLGKAPSRKETSKNLLFSPRKFPRITMALKLCRQGAEGGSTGKLSLEEKNGARFARNEIVPKH